MIKFNPKHVRMLQAMAAVVAITSAVYSFVVKPYLLSPPVAAKSCFLQLTIQN